MPSATSSENKAQKYQVKYDQGKLGRITSGFRGIIFELDVLNRDGKRWLSSIGIFLQWIFLQEPVGWGFPLLKFGKKFEYTGMAAGNTVDYPVFIHSPQTIAFSK